MASDHHRACHWQCSVRRRAFPHEATTNNTLTFAADIHQATGDKDNNTSVVTDDQGESDGSYAVIATITFHTTSTYRTQRQTARRSALYRVCALICLFRASLPCKSSHTDVPPMAIDSDHRTSGRTVRATEHFLPSHDAQIKIRVCN